MAKRDNTVLIVVLVVVVVIVLVVGLLAALVFLTPIVSDGPIDGQPPTMALNANPVAFGDWQVNVMVDRGVALSSFSVVLTNETSGATCVPLRDLSTTFSATCSPGVTLSFVDVAGANQLTSGDYFRLTGVVGPNLYTLRIVWKATDAVIAAELVG